MGNNINNYNTNMMTTNDLMTGFSRSTWSPNAITDDLQVYGGGGVPSGAPNKALLRKHGWRVKDELISVGGRIGKFSGSVKFDDDDLVDDLKAGDRIKSAAKKVGSGIKTAAKKVGSGIKNVAGKVHKSAMKNGGYSGSVSAGGIKGKVGYGNKLDDDDDDDDLADDLALFTAIKEKRQAAKAKRAAKKAAMQEAEVKDDDLVDELWKVGGKIGKFSGSVSRDDLVDELWPAG